MERYALRLLQPAIPAPAGLRVIVVRDDPAGDGPTRITSEMLPVVGIQGRVVHHYASDEPRPVHPDPGLMERLGWHYKHQDSSYAPICITAAGRLEALDPDEPTWLLLPPGTPDDRAELLARRLQDEERIRRALEQRIEDQDQGNLESD